MPLQLSLVGSTVGSSAVSFQRTCPPVFLQLTHIQAELNKRCNMALKNFEKVHTNISTCRLHLVFYQHPDKKSTLLLQILIFQGTATCPCCLPVKSWKGLAHGIFDTFATHSSLHDITDTDGSTHKNSTPGDVLTVSNVDF